MEVADPSRAPPEYKDVAWIADTCKLLMGIGWTTNYVGMIYKSLKDETYAMALMALCCNFAWELTYALIYPFGSDLEMYVHFSGLMLNCGVMYTAVKNAHREWGHSPLVLRNLPLIFVICVSGFMSGHVALAAQVGPSLAQAWSAYGCQLLLSVGGCANCCVEGTREEHRISCGFLGFSDRWFLSPRIFCGTNTGEQTMSTWALPSTFGSSAFFSYWMAPMASACGTFVALNGKRL
ncbi:hypothetical protein NXS19_008005 [Fusarium pseudograminearum]|nr:hypothetical protein NXS19_008005 [Fusarium pseudograminearum]